MSTLIRGALAFATEPSPNPTENTLRPGLEEWQVSPGLVGFIVTFVLAVGCVLLFLNMSKHLRRVGHNARDQGIPVPAPQVVSFRRSDTAGGGAAGGRRDDDPASGDSGAHDTGGSSDSSGGSSGGDSGGGGGGD